MKRYFKTAILTTPFLAMHGIGPLMLFNSFTTVSLFKIFFGLITFIFSFWVINIVLFKKFEIKGFKKYLLSYLLCYVWNFILAFLVELFLKPDFINVINFVYPIAVIFATNTIIIIILNILILQEEKQNSEKEIQALKITNLEAQKALLTQQLQPHFLFNSLSVLKSLITDNPNLAEQYTLKLSDFLRYTTLNHLKDVITIEEELKFVNDYISLQKTRFNDALQFSLSVPSEIQSYKTPVFAIQLLVENAIKHNYFSNKNPLKIEITASENEIIVINNITTIKITERSGTGLLNLQKRLELIVGKDLIVENNETHFKVSVPFLKEK